MRLYKKAAAVLLAAAMAVSMMTACGGGAGGGSGVVSGVTYTSDVAAVEGIDADSIEKECCPLFYIKIDFYSNIFYLI